MRSFLPPQASTFAGQWDLLYDSLLLVSFLGGAILIVAMLYFIVKYRRRTDTDKTAYISHNYYLEFLWTFIPLLVFLGVFAWGAYVYYLQRKVPENAIEIGVTGWQWRWDFQYKSGKKTTNELVVPINTPVKLVMTSGDVIHSLFIPSFRTKQDAVPGMYTMLWFEANQLGTFQIFCTEFCGLQHSNMLAKLKVLPQNEFNEWLSLSDSGQGKAGDSPAQRGSALYQSKACSACHSLDGKTVIGPSFKEIFGKTELLSDGSSALVDENYIRESILNPNAKVVKGFTPGQMPPFQGQLTDDEITDLIEFIKTVK
ncbi:MAG: cytochrome c oxidase subunit II [Bdellovibrionales bacterium]|jgi:cytochrome c oxidase subunit 2|nr:cytochrome c oxidase subunit II [Bdellovibrionales bacterium]